MSDVRPDADTNGQAPSETMLEQLLSQVVDDWMRGAPLPLAVYVDRLPKLHDRDGAVIEMVHQEVALRQMRGETPRIEEYLAVFPDLSESLVRVFEVQGVISIPSTMRDGLDDEIAAAASRAANRAVRIGPNISGYEIERVLGRGGMGVVYLARHRLLNRLVALKLRHEDHQDDPGHLARFKREAAAVARFQHPNLVQIHEVGKYEELEYLALEYVDGGTLAMALAGKPQSARDAAALVETLARAIDHAHSQGVVHRDLKPANVLLTRDGQPKITDFGLAKLKDSSTRTAEGTVVGTLLYMAPEQIRADVGAVGPAVDIHALGCILYEALTGRPPYRAETPERIIHAILEEEVARPSVRHDGVPRDLEAICLKCLEKAPSHRYTTAVEIAEDLRRFLDGRPTLARPLGSAVRLWRWSRRKPWVAGFFLLLSLAGAGITWQAVRATWAEAAAVQQRNRAERAGDQAIAAINAIVLTDKDQMQSEELRPYREMLADEGLRLVTQRLREREYDPLGQRARADALMMQAKLLVEKGEPARATEIGKTAVDILERMVAANPADTHNRDGLGHMLHQFSTIPVDRGVRQSTSQRSCDVYTSLLREHPQSDQASEWVKLICMDLHNIGHEYSLEAGHSDEQAYKLLTRKAIRAFQEGERVCERQLNRSSRPDELVHPLARIRLYICRDYRFLAERTKDLKDKATSLNEAIKYGKQSIADFQGLAEREPANYRYSSDLHLAQHELAELFSNAAQGNSPRTAIPYYGQARDTLKSMAVTHGRLVSRMAAIQSHIALVDNNLSLAYDRSDVVRYYGGPRRAVTAEIYEIFDKLSLVQPLAPVQRAMYADSCLEMADYQAYDGEEPDVALVIRAERLRDQLYRADPKNDEARGTLTLARQKLADILERRGQISEASRWRGLSLDTARGNPELFYRLATVYALNAWFVRKCPGKLNDHQVETRRERFMQHGVDMLREAVADGFRDLKRLRTDPELESLRSSPKFEEVVLDIQFPVDPIAP